MKPIPSISELYTRLESDLKNRLKLSDGDLRFVVDAMAAVLAGQYKLLYLYLTDIQNNQFPDTADLAANGGELERLGKIYLNRLPKPATDGKYLVLLNGSAGSYIRSGLTFKSNDDSNSPGNLYITDAEYFLTGVNDTIAIRSLDAGPGYLLKTGDYLTATEPIIGVDQQVIIISILQIPAEGESTDLYRQNITDAIRLEPQGGSKTDYRLWASDAQGVQRVFPYVKNGAAGVVQVYVEATPTDSVDGYGTPDATLLIEVENVIEFDPDETLPVNERGRRPIQAIMEILPVQIKPVDVQIYTLQTDTLEVRTLIIQNLQTFLFSIRPFIAGADLSRDKNDILTSVKIQSVVSDTIGNVNSFLDLKLSVDGVEVNSFTFSGGNIPYLRAVNYL